MVKQAAQDTISGLLTPINSILKNSKTHQEQLTKARKQREQVTSLLSDQVKSITEVITKKNARITALQKLVALSDEHKTHQLRLQYMGNMPIKPQELKEQESRLAANLR